MLKAQKEMEDALHDPNAGEGNELVSARSRMSTPDCALLRISPLTDVVPEPHVKGIRRSWAYLENDPVKIQLKQEEVLHTEGTLENRMMTKLNPLMKVRPKTATPKLASTRGHFRKTEEGFGHLGDDGSRGDVKLGWIANNLISGQEYSHPLGTNPPFKLTNGTQRLRSSYSSRPSTGVSRASSRASSRSSGGGRRRRELENLISRVRNLEGEIQDVQEAREEVEDELALTRTKIANKSRAQSAAPRRPASSLT